jgi:hypothetical protein
MSNLSTKKRFLGAELQEVLVNSTIKYDILDSNNPRREVKKT